MTVVVLAGAALAAAPGQAGADVGATVPPAVTSAPCTATDRAVLLLADWVQARRAGSDAPGAATPPTCTPSLALRAAIAAATPPAPSPPPAPPVTTPSVPVASAPAPSPPAPTAAPAAPAAADPPGYGCDAALAYLSAHAAPDYQFVCPGDAQGHEAMTCDNWAPLCPGEKLIVISVPCPVAYMNEASNSLVFDHLSSAPIDPYGTGCEP